jgi:signal transduction histidine kinase
MKGSIAAREPRPAVVLTPLRYGLAVLCVAVALFLALSLQSVLDPETLLLGGVLAAAWFAGLWPGLFASLVATLAVDYYFTGPVGSLDFDIARLPRLVLFAALAAVFATASAARRRAEHLLRVARDELEVKVQERTAELQNTNVQLQAEIVERRRAEDVLRQQASLLDELAGRLIHAQEEERSRIGRELHDHISQMLGVLTIKIDQLRTNGDVTPRIGAALDELRRETTEVTDDVHRLSHRLHSSTLDYLGLVPALQKLVSEFSERHNISIAFAHASVPASLPSEIALCLFRVAEESLTNIAKHSKADAAKVHVIGAPDGIHLSVEDAGVGFDTGANMTRPGLGLVSMQERLRAVHGTIQVNSAPSGGTKIDAWVPPSVATADRQEPVH